jgi:hypothetical protein
MPSKPGEEPAGNELIDSRTFCSLTIKLMSPGLEGSEKKKVYFERILQLRLTDLQWCQPILPIRFNGLGIRRISDICLSAFLYSIHGVKKLVSLLLNSKDNEFIICHYDVIPQLEFKLPPKKEQDRNVDARSSLGS